MAESQKGHACHPHSEPPSSNGSMYNNSDSFRGQEDRNFGGHASVSEAFDHDQNACAFPAQMVEVKPCEVNAERRKQGCERPVVDLERPADGFSMFDLERPADDLPCFDLERPAEEYMYVEEGKENVQARTSSTCSLADASVLSSRHIVKVSRHIVTGGNRDLVLGENIDPWGSKKLDSCTSYDCQGTFSIKDKVCKQFWQHGGLGHQCSDAKEDRSSPLSTTLNYSHQDSLACPVEAASTSGLFWGLPDLNHELNSAQNQVSVVQRKPDMNVNDRQYIDLEADSRAPNGTSKLPHWLVQPPSKVSRKSVPPNISAWTSERQQNTTFFSPQVHDKFKSLVTCTPPSGERMNTSSSQEPYHPWSHSKTTSQQMEIPLKEPLTFPSSRLFSGENTGAQKSYEVAHVSGLANESIPSFISYVRDNGKMNLLTASAALSSADRQDIVFDTRASSMELLSRMSSRETTAMSPVLPWYQQKESFSSLIHQASNPKPPCHRPPSFISSVDPWASHQVLPIGGTSNMERGVFKMRSTSSNSRDPVLVIRPESLVKDPVFDFMPSSTEKGLNLVLSMKEREGTTWKQAEKPLFGRQFAPEKTTSSENDHNSIPSRNVFDLNVSCESLPSEENLNAYHFTQSRAYGNQIQGHKQECETISNSGWDFLKGNKALQFNEQQKAPDPQASGFADTVTKKLMVFDVSMKDESQSPNDSTCFTRAGPLCSQRDGAGNDTCADYCSGEDETGGGLVEVKSSDASGLTSCESRDAAHLELTKARDDSNMSSGGEACQSLESGIPCHKEDVALSSNVDSRSTGLPLAKSNGLVESQQWGPFMFPMMSTGPGFDTMRNCSTLACTEFGDESEAANSIARKHSIETAEAAELLLSLGLDLPPVAEEDYAISDNEKSLDWLANIIPQEENCEAQVLGVGVTGMAMHDDKSTHLTSMGAAEKVMDSFELAVLALKPVDPDVESRALHVINRDRLKDTCSSLPNLRRRSSRRGRAGKDFQREVLRSMTSLSRQEITEDLQIIEGLINSTTEAMNSCSLFLEDKPLSSPDSGSQKKARGTKACRGRKPTGTLNVCSWGESTRRKRMGRQRSQRSCLVPGVQSSPFMNKTGDGVVH